MGHEHHCTAGVEGPLYKRIDKIDSARIQTRNVARQEVAAQGSVMMMRAKLCPALHAVAAVIGPTAGGTPKPHQLKRVRCRHRTQSPRIGNEVQILRKREFRIEARSVAHVPDSAADIVATGGRRIDTENGTNTACTRLQSCDQSQKCCLARTIGAEDTNGISGSNCEGHALEDANRTGTYRNILEADERRRAGDICGSLRL